MAKSVKMNRATNCCAVDRGRDLRCDGYLFDFWMLAPSLVRERNQLGLEVGSDAHP